MKAWYQKTSDLGNAFSEFHERISQDNSLDKKTVELSKIAVSSVLRCSHCTQSHIQKAKDLFVTPKEITDALLISALQAAGTQLFWDKEKFEKNLAD